MKRFEQTLRNPWARGVAVILLLAAALLVIWWRGPDWNRAYHSFDFVAWRWICAAVLLNLVSVVFRSLAWRLTINQALPLPHPPFGSVFSAFGVGLLGNAVLPARAGELARVAVLRRRLPQREGTTATLIGTVFAHRLFDLPAVALLVLYVLFTAKLPHWAVTSLIIFGIVGGALLTVGFLSAQRHRRGKGGDGNNTLARIVVMARQGLAVLTAPGPALGAVALQCLAWLAQLFAVYAVMGAFGIDDAGLPAAGLVLLLMNVATIFPLWPGNVGLLQAAVALPLKQYGVDFDTGFAFGLVLQIVEMSVGVGVGLVFLAREGLSLGSLKTMEGEAEAAEEALAVERLEGAEGQAEPDRVGSVR